MNTLDAVSNYEKKALEFLGSTGTVFKIEHIGYGPYFDDDKESRNIYRFTLRRNGKTYSARFGQSIAATADGEEPNAYDVLSCLKKNDPGTFEEFCWNFGYDTDSRKAEKIYKAVCREWAGVSRLFGDCLDQLQGIE